ncbi:MAG: hypothetical protein HPY76_14125, partial [Anaerolineae bacterium]|nr:hypothetical protein [Anaerolineae bacterium]
GLLLETNFYADWLAMVKSLTGLTVCLVGLAWTALAAPRGRGLLAGLWLGYLLYGLVFPYQYRTHEYYHLPLLAVLGLSLIPAAAALVERLRLQPLVWRVGLGVVIAFAAFYSLYAARSTLLAADYANEPASWRRVGEALPAGSRFVALTADYGARLRYYGWRAPAATWHTGGDLELARQAGAADYDFDAAFAQLTDGMDYFLVTALGEFDAQPDLKAALSENHPLLVEGNGFLIYDLRTWR